jgi:uncharacterized protein with HEPN domain
MSKRNTTAFLQDIIEAIRRIQSYTQDLSYDDFTKDNKSQDAVVWNIEIIGEAVKNIPDSVRNEYPTIRWKQIAGTRDRLIHGYFGINLDIVWNIVKQELPSFLISIQEVLKKIAHAPVRPEK